MSTLVFWIMSPCRWRQYVPLNVGVYLQVHTALHSTEKTNISAFHMFVVLSQWFCVLIFFVVDFLPFVLHEKVIYIEPHIMSSCYIKISNNHYILKILLLFRIKKGQVSVMLDSTDRPVPDLWTDVSFETKLQNKETIFICVFVAFQILSE
jgi:hypothetical protein